MSISDLYRATASIRPTDLGQPERAPASKDLPNAEEFKSILDGQVRFSRHAESRIRSRQIPWSDAIESRVAEGIAKAESKGSKEALILLDDLAVIANVQSRTIVTAMDKEQMKEKIFTNIDSTVLA